MANRFNSLNPEQLKWTINDIKEALVNAVNMEDFDGIAKYTEQLKQATEANVFSGEAKR
jgi:hypothetical protein